MTVASVTHRQTSIKDAKVRMWACMWQMACMWRRECDGENVAECMWRSACGGEHVADSMWRRVCEWRRELMMWRRACGGEHVAQWRGQHIQGGGCVAVCVFIYCNKALVLMYFHHLGVMYARLVPRGRWLAPAACFVDIQAAQLAYMHYGPAHQKRLNGNLTAVTHPPTIASPISHVPTLSSLLRRS